MKIEEATKKTEETIQEIEKSLAQCSLNFQNKLIELKKALELTLTDLHSMQEARVPLTMEQLREMKGKTVLIRELANDKKYYAVIRLVSGVGVNLFDDEYGEDYGSFSMYGKTWLTYHIDRSKWVSVKERLPDKGKNVIVYATAKYIGGEKTAIDRLEEGENHPIWMYTHGWFEVAHWMPLPEPPEEG